MLLSGHIRREAGIVLFVSGWISQCHIAFLASTATLIPHVVMAFWQMLMIWHKWFRDAGQGAVFRISGFYHLLAYGLEGQVCLSRFLNFVKLISSFTICSSTRYTHWFQVQPEWHLVQIGICMRGFLFFCICD